MAQGDTQHPTPEDGDGLGLAGAMAKGFLHSPLSPLFLFACLALGILGLFITPRQEDPQISVPMVDVFFQYPGASSAQVASLATDPLERMMSEIPGVKHVYSASERGRGMVTVEYDVGQEMGPSLVKLYDKLMSNLDKIPPGVSQPLVKPKGVDDVPVVTLTLWSRTLDDGGLRLVALELLQRLKEVSNTSQNFIVGGRPEQMRVEIIPERLSGYGISLSRIASQIRAANMRSAVGTAELAGRSMTVYSGSFLRHAADLERLIIGVRNGSPVYLRDVATITEGPGEGSNLVQYFTGPAAPEGAARVPEGAAAVTIAIAKKPGTNGVSVAQNVLDKVETLKGQVIPENVEVAVTRNYGKTANDKVNELLFKLFVATGAVAILIFLVLGLRAALVVLMVIPVVILVTVFSAWALGYTIDRVSLFALIFSIGILVDDAIVVVENIYRRWLIRGEIDSETTVDAVREVGNPTILATFTVIAALLPMGFVSGMMGPYMEPIPALGSVAMLFSLFAAFIFTPWLAYRLRPSLARLGAMQSREHAQTDRLGRFYERMLGPFLDSRRKARFLKLAIWFVFLALTSLFYTTDVTVKMLPLDNKPEFNVVVNMPEGTALAGTANVTQQLVEKILRVAEVTAVQSYSGTASPFNFNGLVRHYYLRQKPWQGDIQVQLLDKTDRDRSSHEIAIEVRDLLTPLAKRLGARIQVVEMPPGPPVLQTLVAEIYGPDDKTRRQVARDLTKIFEDAEGVVDVDSFLPAPNDTLRFMLDRQKAMQQGVNVATVNKQLAMIMGGYRLGDAKLGHELEPRRIVMQAPLNIRGQITRLGEVPIPGADGKLVPLASIGRFIYEPQDPYIFHKDLRPVEFVTGEVAGRLAAPIYGMLSIGKLLQDYTAPDGVSLGSYWLGPPADSFKSAFEWTGEWTVTFETFRDMGLAFGVAMILIYMLVVWEFGNFRLPGIIMAPIPLTLVGIIPGHWLLGAEFTATSMIGFIALGGIIVRNSILLADFSKSAILSGLSHREAVLQAVKTRTRPILITALALLAGSSVIITDPIFQGMAISLMFGGMVSTLLTLVITPLSCSRADIEWLSANERANGGQMPQSGTPSAPAASRTETDKAGRPGLFARIGSAIVMGLYLISAVFIMGGIGLKALFARSGKIRTWLVFGFYALRALPYFLWLATREAWKSLVARFAPQPIAAGAAGGSMPVPAATASTPPSSTPPPAAGTATPAATPVSTEPGPDAAAAEDDLTRINGIGPVLHKRLNELGVTRFAQIAAWGAEDIGRIGGQLKFKGRIERENWVEQAARLAAGDKEQNPS